MSTPKIPPDRLPSWMPSLAASAWLSTVLLILVGSIVRVTGFGLGCPDWPLCYGQPIPPAYTAAWVEFSHRILGAIVAIQVISLAALSWRYYRRDPWIFRPAMAAVGLITFQILLGGLHVVLENPPETGLVHTATALLIVGLLAVLLARTASFTRNLAIEARAAIQAGWLPSLITATTASSYLLLLTGSYVTRTGASLACLAFPACGAVEQASQSLVEIHMLHRFAALFVTGLTIATLVGILRGSPGRALRRFAAIIGVLLTFQLALGIANVLFLIPMWSRVLHITVGATFWSSLVILWVSTRSSMVGSQESRSSVSHATTGA